MPVLWMQAASLAILHALNPATAESLMQKIEDKVILPQGAGPLSDYGRNYAFSDEDDVTGVFVIPPQPYKENMGCLSGGKPCSPEVVIGMINKRDKYIASQAAAGSHRWLDNVNELPMIMDGGCSVITLRYRVSTGVVTSVHCSGVA